MNIKVAVVQPESVYGEEEYKNVERALSYLREAAEKGAQLICFPEGYPGPAHGPLDSGGRLKEPPIESICKKAREFQVYVSASNVELNNDKPNTYFLCQKLISSKGQIIGNHRRFQPDEPDLNEYLFGGKRNFAPGENLTVVDTELGKIGLLICSELFVPELARIEMLMGAEIIIAPVNGFHAPSLFNSEDPPLFETWRCISRARAAENLVYVIVTQNIFVRGYKGVGHVAGPEKMLAKSKEPGIFYAELEMNRLRWLRSHMLDRSTLGKIDKTKSEIDLPLGTRPGQHLLRRPEAYGLLVQRLESDFDYFYYLNSGQKTNGEHHGSLNLNNRHSAMQKTA